jgi:hypothetical protein
MALLKLTDKYPPQRLEAACSKAFSFTASPSLKSIQSIPRSYWKPNKDKIGIEKIWNTAALKDESISHGSIPWLIRLQIQRGWYHSKPMTIRQAKWFDRLSGFRQYLESGVH